MKKLANSKSSSSSTNTTNSSESSSAIASNASEKSKSYPPETLLSLAVEAAIIGLGQQRIMPPGSNNILR